MSETPAKLSRSQRELLARLTTRTTQRTVKNYSTAYVLKRLGLVTISDVPSPYGWELTITDAGRAHPAATTQGEAP